MKTPSIRILLILLNTCCLVFPSGAESVQEAQQAHWQASLTAEQSGDLQTAIKEVSAYDAVGGERYWSLARVAWLQYSLGKYEDAAKLYDKAATASRDAVAPWVGLAYCLKAKGDLNEAATACNQALRRDSGNYAALLLLGEISYGLKNYTQAMECFKKLSDRDPLDSVAKSWLAWALLAKGDRRSAEALFQQVIVLDPSNTLAGDGLRFAQGKLK